MSHHSIVSIRFRLLFWVEQIQDLLDIQGSNLLYLNLQGNLYKRLYYIEGHISLFNGNLATHIQQKRISYLKSDKIADH